MTELAALGSPQTANTWKDHGAPDQIFGVKVADMKAILKRTKKDHALALQLWDTGNSDAQYLAALMADEKRIDVAMLDRWARTATRYMLAEYSVAWVTAESGHGWTCGLRWIDDPSQMVAMAGWSSLGGHLAGTPDEQLDLAAIEALLDRVATTIHAARSGAVGKVHVDMGDTACKVPCAPEYIEKVLARGPATKRKTFRC